jgi:hypothetical protein
MADNGGELERIRLAQERELKERELDLKQRELDLQDKSAKWSTPIILAIVAGFIGYAGTFFSGQQNISLEREKQEATLILEAIKTSGNAADKERQTAANLVFFADAGLIKSIRKAELDKLRVKAQNAIPSLPVQKGAVEFDPSITASLQTKLQSALADYQRFFSGIGYASNQAKDQVTVRIDQKDPDNASFDNRNIVLGSNLAGDPEYMISEYTWYVLRVEPQGI